MQFKGNPSKPQQSGHAFLTGAGVAFVAALFAPGLIGLARAAAADTPAAATSAASAATAPAKASATAKPGTSSPAKPASGKGPEPTFEKTDIDRPFFTLSYPSTWTEDKAAATYDPNSNFTLISPKNSYVQFSIMGLADDPSRIVSDTVKKLDGPTITSLSKTKLEEWGNHKGTGYHLRGKIFGSYPGGIKVFAFTYGKHNVLVTEFYFSDELKDVLGDFEYISRNFSMKS